MTTFDDVVAECVQALNGYGLSQPRAAWLTAAVVAADLVFTVDDATGFSPGVAEIGSETVYIRSVDTTTNTLTIAPDGRGYYGTTAADYPINTRIESQPPFPASRVRTAINDTITATWPTLFAVDTASFTPTGVATTFELPADTEAILSVSATTVGPSKEQQTIHRYAFSRTAPTDVFPSGCSITLQECVMPGQTVTVTYMKQPTQLTTGDLFTDSGLRLSAKPAIVYGACANLLSFMDAARMPADTAVASELGDVKRVGTASQIAAQLTARFEMELEKERKRLRSTTPVAITVRVR